MIGKQIGITGIYLLLRHLQGLQVVANDAELLLKLNDFAKMCEKGEKLILLSKSILRLEIKNYKTNLMLFNKLSNKTG